MINVSNEWKHNQQQNLVSESFISITFKITDPTAHIDGEISDNGKVWYSNVAETLTDEEEITQYSTLEQNFWLLDGSRTVLPNTSTPLNETHFISNNVGNISYDINPTLTVTFPIEREITIPSITVTFDKENNEYARDFNVYVFKGTTLKETIEVRDNTKVSAVAKSSLVDYDKVVVVVLSWCLPNRRVRVSEILMGQRQVYDKSTLMSYSHKQDVDPICATLPTYEIKFAVDNTDNTFNPDNEDGLYPYIVRQQELDLKYGFKIRNSIEWINIGKYYLSEWDTPQNGIEATFTARDLLEFMRGNYLEGTFSTTPQTLYSLAENVLTKARLPLNADGTPKWTISNTLQNYQTKSPLPICSFAEALQYIAQASKSCLFYDNLGNLHIEPITPTLTDYSINKFNSYSFPEISLQKILKNVTTKIYHYYEGEPTVLFDGVVSVNGDTTLLITYSKAGIGQNTTITDGTIISVDYYTNTCKLRILAFGDVGIVINGTALENSTSNYILTNDEDGEEQTVDNPLIDNVAWANDVSQWVKNWLSIRKMISCEYRSDPRLECLDTVSVQKKIGENQYQNVQTTSVTYEYKGAFKGTVKGREVIL